MPRIRTRRPEIVPVERVPHVRGREEIASRFPDFLRDESRLSGSAEWLFFPENESHVASVLAWAEKEGVPVTVSGARTGIVGGAVPQGGAVLSLQRMDRLVSVLPEGDRPLAEVLPGLSLEDLDRDLRSGAGDLPGGMFFFPPDPTETSAHVGGAIANNASGARTFRYGPTRLWVEALDVALPGGDVLSLGRGGACFDENGVLDVETSRGTIRLLLPPRPPLDVRKDVAGYHVAPGMEPVDLFIGSEGTLGVVTRALLRLEPAPAGRLSAMLFPAEEAAALDAVRLLREGFGDIAPESIEFFDGNSLELLRAAREEAGPGGPVPPFPFPAAAAVFFELPYSEEADLDDLFEKVLLLCEEIDLPEDRSWVADSEEELSRMKAFRHALPETVNSIIGRRKASCPALRKVATDLAVPVRRIDEFLAFHHELLADAGLQYAVWGHIGDAHLHCNILPEDEKGLEEAVRLYGVLARKSVELGGTVAAEHGIGRLKKEFLSLLLPEETIRGMKRLKLTLDPAGILSPGVLF